MTQLWTKKQAADYFQVCTKVIQKWMHDPRNPLPFIRLSKTNIRFDPADLEKYAQARKVVLGLHNQQ